jgi:HEAT repeat protein
LRFEPIIAAGELKDIRLSEPLIQLLESNSLDPYTLAKVATSLSQIGDRRAIQPLINAFHKYPYEFDARYMDYDPHSSILWAVFKLAPNDEETIQLTMTALEQKSGKYFWLRRSAIDLAAVIQDERFIPKLIKLLDDWIPFGYGEPENLQRAHNCQYVVEALEAIGTEQALDAIEGVECPEDEVE